MKFLAWFQLSASIAEWAISRDSRDSCKKWLIRNKLSFSLCKMLAKNHPRMVDWSFQIIQSVSGAWSFSHLDSFNFTDCLCCSFNEHFSRLKLDTFKCLKAKLIQFQRVIHQNLLTRSKAKENSVLTQMRNFN
jgi:hypothetical protein